VQTDILPNAPAQLLHRLDEGRHAILSFRIVGGERCEYADAPHSLALLRTRGERPYRGSSNSLNKIAPPAPRLRTAIVAAQTCYGKGPANVRFGS